MPLSIGEKVGHYEVLSLLGQGGMGEVYRARDTTLKREVALKFLPSDFLGNPNRIARFQREAEVLASLDHPNIGPIYGLLESECSRALVLALVDGPTLADRIALGPLPLDEAVAISKQVIDALEYAHDRGVVHRDLKPANLKITSDGMVKVLDFGLAKVLEDELPRSPLANSPTLTLGHTRVGMILGTAAYMSPEQAVGRTVDRRSDIFSFGAVLYEMLTGTRAFPGTATPDVLEAVVKRDPDWEALPGETPQYLRTLLKRMLEKDRRERLQAIGEARIVLAKPPVEQPAAAEEAMAAPKSRFGSVAWIGAIVFFAVAAALATIRFREPAPLAPQVLEYTIDPPEKSNIQSFVLSPDGRSIAMATTSERGDQLLVRPLDSFQAQPLAGTDGAVLPFWSPDSRYIAFFAQGKLKKIAVTGGPTQTLCDLPTFRGGTWSRDGTILFPSTLGVGIRRVSAGGGVPVPVTQINNSTHRFPVFLPDGRRFLYSYSVVGAATGIYVGSLDDKPEAQGARRLVSDLSTAQYLPPSGNESHGYVVFLRGQTLMALPVDPARMEAAGDVFPVAEQVGSEAAFGNGFFSLSAGGILAYRAGTGGLRQHAWFDRTGKQLASVGGPVTTSGHLALSPDEKKLVTLKGQGGGGINDLWMTELDRGTESRFTFIGQVFAPVWSPDGKRVVFDRAGAKQELYVQSADGSGQGEVLAPSGATAADWTPDGRYIIARMQGPKNSLAAIPVSGDHKPIPLLQGEPNHNAFNEVMAQVSPDGRWLAYASDESGQYEVYVQPFDVGAAKSSGKWQISIGGGRDPRWRKDGREMFYVAPDGKMMAVDINPSGESLGRGIPHALFTVRYEVEPTTINRYAVSADGKRFLMAAEPEVAMEAAPLRMVVNWLASVKR